MSRLRTAAAQTHDCGQTILTGLDDDTCAGTATVDPTPLTAIGEALALIDGRCTYALTWRASLPELDQRTQWDLRARDADHTVVLPEHRCHTAPLPTHGTPITLDDPDLKETPDEPDF